MPSHPVMSGSTSKLAWYHPSSGTTHTPALPPARPRNAKSAHQLVQTHPGRHVGLVQTDVSGGARCTADAGRGGPDPEGSAKRHDRTWRGQRGGAARSKRWSNLHLICLRAISLVAMSAMMAS